MIIEIRAATSFWGSPIFSKVIAILRKEILSQKPQDNLFTVQKISLLEQEVYPVCGDTQGQTSNMITVICWHEGAFFHATDPDIDRKKRKAMAQAVTSAFTDFELAIWFAPMDNFNLAVPVPEGVDPSGI